MPNNEIKTMLKTIITGGNKKQLESRIVIVNAREVTRQHKCCLHHIFSSAPNNVDNDDTCFAEPAIEK